MTDFTDADFESTLVFNAPVDKVFDAITQPTHLSNWWTVASGNGLQGGEVDFDFVVMHVDRADRPSLVQWTAIDCSAEPEWVGTTVTFDIAALPNGGSTVHFRHAGLRALTCYELCREGWTHFLASLVSYVETGEGAPVGSPAAANRHANV